MSDDNIQEQAVDNTDVVDSGADSTDASPAENTAVDQPQADESRQTGDSSEDGADGDLQSPDGNTDTEGENSDKPRRPDKRTRAIERLAKGNGNLLQENEQLRRQLESMGVNTQQAPQNVQRDIVSELGLQAGQEYSPEEIAKLIDDRAAQKAAEMGGSIDFKARQAAREEIAYTERKAKLEADIQSVARDYDELNPDKKDSFDPELDDFIAENYAAQLRLNPDLRLKDFVDRQIKLLRKTGERRAASMQSSLAEKAAGQVLTPTSGSSDSSPDPSKMSATEYAAKAGLRMVE